MATQTEIDAKMSTGFRAIDRLNLDKQRQALRLYKQSLTNIQSQIASLFEKMGDNPTLNEASKYNRLNNLERAIKIEIQKLTQAEATITASAIRESFRESFNVTGYAVESTLLVKGGFGYPLNSAAVNAAIFNKMDLIKWNESLRTNQAVYLRDIKRAVSQGLMQGEGYGKIARNVKKRADIGASKLIRIINTETHRAQSEGTLTGHNRLIARGDDIGVKSNKKWISTLDDKTRGTHASLDQQLAEVQTGGSRGLDSAVFTSPNGYTATAPGLFGVAAEDINCVLADTNIISPEINKATKRYYEGELVEITTANNVITATPNHPILTEKGFIPFNLVNKGDNVINCTFEQDVTSPNPKPNNRPLRIEQLFSFLNVIGTSQRVAGITPQFDGDGFNSNVDVISLKGFLWGWIQSMLFKDIENVGFSIANFTKGFLFRKSGFPQALLSWLIVHRYLMTCFNLVNSLGFAHSVPLQRFGFRLRTSIDTILKEKTSDGLTTDIERFCKDIFGDSVNVALNDVIGIRKYNFRGHVYNLETVNEFYCASNIQKDNDNFNILHNCRCDMTLSMEGVNEGKYRRARENGKSVLTENMSYTEWAKARGIKTKAIVKPKISKALRDAPRVKF